MLMTNLKCRVIDVSSFGAIVSSKRAQVTRSQLPFLWGYFNVLLSVQLKNFCFVLIQNCDVFRQLILNANKIIQMRVVKAHIYNRNSRCLQIQNVQLFGNQERQPLDTQNYVSILDFLSRRPIKRQSTTLKGTVLHMSSL